MALHLGVASDGPTRRRLTHHLPSHGIAVHHLPIGETVYELGSVAEAMGVEVDIGFVFPPRVPEGMVVSAELDIPWVNDHADILTTRNKAGSLARLHAEGIPIPRTLQLSSPVGTDALRRAFDSFDGPVVIKPNATTKGTGLARIDDEDTLLGVANYLDLIHTFPATADRSFLMQAYVPDARDCRLTLIDGTVAGAVERRRSMDDGWVRNVHRGGETVAIDPPDAVVTTAERVGGILDIDLLGVDLLVTDAGPLVLEVNGRPTIDRIEMYPDGFYAQLAAVIQRNADGR